MSSSYMWSHYSEFIDDPDATDAYKRWADALTPGKGWALDIGCAVGRLHLEMTKSHDRAVGIDTSLSFIRSARKMMRQRVLDFDLILEGEITERGHGRLDQGFRFEMRILLWLTQWPCLSAQDVLQLQAQ
jgi:2-polyprenyl-3-methyl-5-hydroxy-6-metoxy-1,4-benzoquinol methylase